MSIRLMTDVWDLPGVGSATTRLVLLALADQANEDGFCWPFMATIASRADCGLSTARKACADLEAKGFLRRRLQKSADGDNDRSVYYLNAELITRLAGAARSERGAARIERGGPPGSGGGAARIWRDNPHENHQEEPSAAATASEALFEVEQPPEAPKATPPKTVNQRATVLAQQQYDRLGRMGNVPAFVKIIKQAIGAGYEDLVIDQALAYIAENRWTLTAERLANTLRGGPKLPARPAPNRPDGTRLVGNQRLEGY